MLFVKFERFAAFTKLILNTKLHEFWMSRGLCESFGNTASESTDDLVIFDGDEE